MNITAELIIWACALMAGACVLLVVFILWLGNRSNGKEARQYILLDVTNVEARVEYKLHLEFENGEKRVFDMSPYMAEKPFIRVKDPTLFTQAFVDYGTVVWPGNIDIAPETLYDKSQPI